MVEEEDSAVEDGAEEVGPGAHLLDGRLDMRGSSSEDEDEWRKRWRRSGEEGGKGAQAKSTKVNGRKQKTKETLSAMLWSALNTTVDLVHVLWTRGGSTTVVQGA